MSEAAKDEPGIRNTRVLGREEARAALEAALLIGAEASESATVGMQFGWAWALELDDWEVRTVPWAEVMPRVLAAEKAGHGKIGDDDLSLHIGLDVIEFCHHGDIHLPVTPVTTAGAAICRHLEPLLRPTA